MSETLHASGEAEAKQSDWNRLLKVVDQYLGTEKRKFIEEHLDLDSGIAFLSAHLIDKDINVEKVLHEAGIK